jgi:hypothetical protein
MNDLNPEFAGLGAPISYGVKTLHLSDLMPIGKFKGEPIDSLIINENKYMQWFIDTIDRYKLSKEALLEHYLWEDKYDPRDDEPKELNFDDAYRTEEDIPW